MESQLGQLKLKKIKKKDKKNSMRPPKITDNLSYQSLNDTEGEKNRRAVGFTFSKENETQNSLSKDKERLKLKSVSSTKSTKAKKKKKKSKSPRMSKSPNSVVTKSSISNKKSKSGRRRSASRSNNSRLLSKSSTKSASYNRIKSTPMIGFPRNLENHGPTRTTSMVRSLTTYGQDSFSNFVHTPTTPVIPSPHSSSPTPAFDSRTPLLEKEIQQIHRRQLNRESIESIKERIKEMEQKTQRALKKKDALHDIIGAKLMEQ